MTDLDDLTALRGLDPGDMLGHVAALPHQCRDAWDCARRLRLHPQHRGAGQVVIAGMGGSAIGGDLAAAVVAGAGPVPVFVHRDYDLPAWADRHTLVIACSYSGNTEETLSAAEAAHRRGCPLVALTTGGELFRVAHQWQVPCLSFDYRSQPRAALGYLLVSILGILDTLGRAGNVADELAGALSLLEAQGPGLAPESPQAENLAKQLAVRLVGRVPVVVGADHLASVARRWKTQLNENSKSWAYFEVLPEMDHNALSGIHFPEVGDRLCVLFLTSATLRARNRLRIELTKQIFEGQGIGCISVPIAGVTPLAQILAAVQLGDFTSCYLALSYGTDPTAIEDIIGMKQHMAPG